MKVFERIICVPHFGYQIMETMDSKTGKLSQESHVWREKRLKLVSACENFYPKRDYKLSDYFSGKVDQTVAQ